jgi:hypothetical protein
MNEQTATIMNSYLWKLSDIPANHGDFFERDNVQIKLAFEKFDRGQSGATQGAALLKYGQKINTQTYYIVAVGSESGLPELLRISYEHEYKEWWAREMKERWYADPRATKAEMLASLVPTK